MCKLMEELQDEREKETLIRSIRNLMKTLNLTVKQAMNALKVPIDKQKEYLALI